MHAAWPQHAPHKRSVSALDKPARLAHAAQVVAASRGEIVAQAPVAGGAGLVRGSPLSGKVFSQGSVAGRSGIFAGQNRGEGHQSQQRQTEQGQGQSGSSCRFFFPVHNYHPFVSVSWGKTNSTPRPRCLAAAIQSTGPATIRPSKIGHLL